MKKLFLIRHAHAEKYSESNLDIDRKLTSEGMKVASLVGKYLMDEGMKPEAVISSSAHRALLTAELVATQLDFDIEKIQGVELLYKASVREFVDFIGHINDDLQSVLIVGHNPTITYVSDYLCSAEISSMSPGALVQINFSIDSWSVISKEAGEFINSYDMAGDN